MRNLAAGSRALIEGFPDINKQPGVMLKPDRKPLFSSDVFLLRSEVDVRAAQGIWKIELVAKEA